MTIFAVSLACLILAGLSVFQILLVFGFPLGNFAWGGQHRILPAKLRTASLFAVALYILFALIMMEKGGYISVLPAWSIADVGIWILTIYFFIGTAMQALSRSKAEKYAMTPVALVLAVLSLIIALN